MEEKQSNKQLYRTASTKVVFMTKVKKKNNEVKKVWSHQNGHCDFLFDW